MNNSGFDSRARLERRTVAANAIRRRVGPLLSLLLLVLVSASATPPEKPALGIFPVFEMGDSKLGSAFTQHLTTMIFRQLQEASFDPVLLNPGGFYVASPDNETLEYARRQNVTIVLMTSLLSTDMPVKGDFLARVEGKLVNTQTGDIVASWQSTAPLNKHEVMAENVKTYGPEGTEHAPGVYGRLGTPGVLHNDNKAFEKRKLGKTAHKISGEIRDQVLHAAPPLLRETAPAAASGKSCSVTFKVAYPSRHAISKSYDIIVNGKDETLDEVEGNLPLTLDSGPVLIQLSLHDYHKLPVQDVYQANTRLDCSPDQHTLVLELDPAGAGTLKWQE